MFRFLCHSVVVVFSPEYEPARLMAPLEAHHHRPPSPGGWVGMARQGLPNAGGSPGHCIPNDPPAAAASFWSAVGPHGDRHSSNLAASRSRPVDCDLHSRRDELGPFISRLEGESAGKIPCSLIIRPDTHNNTHRMQEFQVPLCLSRPPTYSQRCPVVPGNFRGSSGRTDPQNKVAQGCTRFHARLKQPYYLPCLSMDSNEMLDTNTAYIHDMT